MPLNMATVRLGLIYLANHAYTLECGRTLVMLDLEHMRNFLDVTGSICEKTTSTRPNNPGTRIPTRQPTMGNQRTSQRPKQHPIKTSTHQPLQTMRPHDPNRPRRRPHSRPRTSRTNHPRLGTTKHPPRHRQETLPHRPNRNLIPPQHHSRPKPTPMAKNRSAAHLWKTRHR